MAEEIPRNMDAKLSNAIDVCAAKLQATYLAPEAETTNAMNAMVDAMFDAIRLMPGGVAEDKTGQEFVSHVKTQWLTEQVVFRMLNDLESQLCATLGEESDEQHRNAVRAEFAAMFAEIMEEFETTFSKDES